ncbi:uncharacterized protein UPF0227 [Alkalispirillum mobile]|uniref:Uncharacterized protein UPF0227 n=1 Tax=Alkalispirillum mobile TaxID=85925 RepID=A0A498BSK9_9GAMM|nr:alpha/beta fold hydrolase [Alkalispirillum mobile]RLK46964.1 uncharacterized protein UPF0227 [Alkalispirillum mobile]
MSTVFFAHGKESGPWGRKISALADVAREAGFQVESPDYSHTFDPDERVRQLLALAPEQRRRPLVLVGSSMGGYVSAVAAERVAVDGLFLLAPALYMPGYPAEPRCRARRMTVVHGWNDAIVPVDNGIRLARAHRARLHVLDAGHDLNETLPWLCETFARFLGEVRAD